jgi:hypothetical protein
VFFDSGDVFGPGRYAFVGYSGGVFSFGFGEDVEGVLELLLKGGAGHRGRVSPGAGSQSTQVTNLPCGWDRVNRG